MPSCLSPVLRRREVMGVQMPGVLDPCRRCAGCLARRRLDYTGRTIMEAEASSWTCLLTLTYRNDEGCDYRSDGAASVVVPKHLTDATKLMRYYLAQQRIGVRYVAVSEEGTLRGRVHFHVFLFGDGPRPAGWPEHGQRFWPEFWPHGHCQVSWVAASSGVPYLMKYLDKGQGPATDRLTENIFRYSNKPILGAAGIAALGKRCASHGLLPVNGRYTLSGVARNWTYNLSGRGRLRLVEATLLEASSLGRVYDPAQASDLILNDITRLRALEHKETAETALFANGGDFFMEQFRLALEEKRSRYERRRALAPTIDARRALDVELELVGQSIADEFGRRERRRRLGLA